MNNKKQLLFGIAFLVSVMANMFALGVFVAGPCNRGMPPGPPHFSDDLRRAASTLAPETRAKIDAIIEKHETGIEGHKKDIGPKFEKLRALLTAGQFDKKAFNAAHEEMKALDAARKEEIYAMIVNIVDTLTPAERIELFSHMPSPPGEGGKHGGPRDISPTDLPPPPR